MQTRSHFPVFDHVESGATMPPGVSAAPPADASLASGFIVPPEIADQNVLVFVSHAHRDHFDPVVLTWKKHIPEIRYVFGWDVEGPPDILRADEPRRSYVIDGVRVSTVLHDIDGIPEAAFLVQADGIALCQSGDHGSTPSVARRFADNIDYFAGIARDIDITFTVTRGGADYVVETLSPRMVLPQQEVAPSSGCAAGPRKAPEQNLRARVCVVERRGDRFLYAGGTVASGW